MFEALIMAMDYEHYATGSDLIGCEACADYGWICAAHHEHPCLCGGAEKPCRCNPEAFLPEDFLAVPPADLPGVSAAGALGFAQKF